MDTETIQTTNDGEIGEGSMGLEAVNSGSRTGFGAFVQSFKDDSFYFSVGFQRTAGDYDLCVFDDCVDVDLRVDDMNVELGWATRQWTPFIEFSRTDINSNVSTAFDTETDLDFGIGSRYQLVDNTNLKIKISGLRNDDSQTITAGFQRTLQSNFTVDGSFTYPLTQDVTGFGFRFAVGWTLQP